MQGSNLLGLVRLRFLLLIRQKLGWISALTGVALVFLSLITAQVSYISPLKIFWDFALGAMFAMLMVLSVFLGTQLFSDELGRRTLHLLLSAGLSRRQWVLGNVLGLWLALVSMLVLWFLTTLITSFIAFGDAPTVMAMQATILLGVEVLVVLQLGFLLALNVRPVLALLTCAIAVVFLHSVTSIERIFVDPQVGRYVQGKSAVSLVIDLSKLLPPLEWFDLKLFVGYEPSIAWSTVLGVTAVGLLWSAALFGLSWLRFEKMDL